MNTPMEWFDRVVMVRWMDYRHRVDAMLVQRDHKRMRNQTIWAGGKFLIGLALIMLFTWTTDVGSIWTVGLGLVVGTFPMQNLARAQSYRSGWLEGRRAAFSAHREAERRGLSTDDWIAGEYERDLNVFGS